jgi:hypothetical protein
MNKQINIIVSLITAYVLSAVNTVYAALPTGAAVTTGAGVTNTTSPFVFVKELLTSGVGIAAVAISALTVLGVAWTSYAAFVESRQKGEWKNFGVTASIGVVLVLGVVLMSILAVDYAA